MNIQLVNKGDIIVEGNRTTTVRKIEHNACSKLSVHINDSQCYDAAADVVVRRAETVEVDSSLDEIDEGLRQEEIGTVRVGAHGISQDDMDTVMSNIMAIAEGLFEGEVLYGKDETPTPAGINDYEEFADRVVQH